MDFALHRSTASALTRASARSRALAAQVREWLPRGNLLSSDEWRRRHRMIVRIVYVQALTIPLMAVFMGRGAIHGIQEAAPVLALAFLAQQIPGLRGSIVATLGMTTAIAIVV